MREDNVEECQLTFVHTRIAVQVADIMRELRRAKMHLRGVEHLRLSERGELYGIHDPKVHPDIVGREEGKWPQEAEENGHVHARCGLERARGA